MGASDSRETLEHDGVLSVTGDVCQRGGDGICMQERLPFISLLFLATQVESEGWIGQTPHQLFLTGGTIGWLIWQSKAIRVAG